MVELPDTFYKLTKDAVSDAAAKFFLNLASHSSKLLVWCRIVIYFAVLSEPIVKNLFYKIASSLDRQAKVFS